MNKAELVNLIKQKKSFLCVGLDPDYDRIPQWIKDNYDDPVFEFCRIIVDATIDFAVAFKPNLAFFEHLGESGWQSLQKTINYINNHPSGEVFTIADAKRGDIGNSASFYAKAFYDNLGFDSATVNPYMGKDAIDPFLAHEGKWAIVLALTSNQGAFDFQIDEDLQRSGLFEEVIKKCTNWGTPDNLMFVVGATRGELIRKAREIAPDHFFLVPGVGAQGGSLQDVAKNAMTKDCGLLVNVSRQIIFASSGKDLPEKAREVAAGYQSEMENLLANLHIGTSK